MPPFLHKLLSFHGDDTIQEDKTSMQSKSDMVTRIFTCSKYHNTSRSSQSHRFPRAKGTFLKTICYFSLNSLQFVKICFKTQAGKAGHVASHEHFTSDYSVSAYGWIFDDSRLPTIHAKSLFKNIPIERSYGFWIATTCHFLENVMQNYIKFLTKISKINLVNMYFIENMEDYPDKITA